jgi:phenylalanyl-tRNA synthetase beta chain
MRTSLLPGLLETVARNINFRSLDLRLFEIRRVYMPVAGESMPFEPLFIVGAMTGSRDGDGWSRPKELVDFYDAKGTVESLLDLLDVRGISWVVDTVEPYYHPGKSCSIMAGRDRIGSVGELHPTVQENFGIEKPVFCFELDFEKLVKNSGSKQSITAPSRFPDSTRDIAMLVPDDLQSEMILGCIRGVKAKEIESVQIFDVYRGKGIPEGFASIAVRIRYRSYERTLTEDEIISIHKKVTDNLVNKLQVTLR